MKTKTTMLALILLAIFTACSGGGGGDSSDGSDKIFVDQSETGPNTKDLPIYDLVESDVIKVSCGEDDITEDGFLTISCLDRDGDTTSYALITCDAGEMGISVIDDDDYVFEDTCMKLLCSSNGDRLILKECE